ncbi:SelT/SelW/SelH family protein [Endozoicomonadaceae bacterium StTr2]
MNTEAPKPSVSIEYCTGCQWLLRAGWLAQELLMTFSQDLAEVKLVPGYGGIFRVEVDGVRVWDRKENGGFPQPKEIKQKLRDVIDPERDLGHIDTPR